MRFLKDETYINLWRWIVSKTQGYRVVITCVVILIIVGLAIMAVNRPAWPTWTGLNGKTAWDFASLLIVPLALAVIAYFFNKRQKESELEIAKEERELEREIARDRQREAALQTYLDQMKELLLEKDLLKSQPGDEIRAVALTLTVVTMRRLDGKRNETLLRFLGQAGLIEKDESVIDFREADLSKIDLSQTLLPNIDLSKAILIEADLHGVHLRGAHLRGAALFRASLRKAGLREADLSGANLRGANLREAGLFRADLSRANLNGADLNGAYLREANLSGALLSKANLSKANLNWAKYNAGTIWPTGFDPEAAGAIKVDD